MSRGHSAKNPPARQGDERLFSIGEQLAQFIVERRELFAGFLLDRFETGGRIVGATLDLELVWNIAEMLNGFMAIPNLIALLGLSGVVIKLTKEYFAAEKLKK